MTDGARIGTAEDRLAHGLGLLAWSAVAAVGLRLAATIAMPALEGLAPMTAYLACLAVGGPAAVFLARR